MLVFDHRQRRGLTEEALAALIGVSKHTVWRVEHGRRCGAETLSRFAHWLDIPTANFTNAPVPITVDAGDSLTSVRVLIERDHSLPEVAKASLFRIFEIGYQLAVKASAQGA